MSLSSYAANKLLSWLGFCLKIGWPKESLPVLRNIWLKWHVPETGNLKKCHS